MSTITPQLTYVPVAAFFLPLLAVVPGVVVVSLALFLNWGR